MRHVGSAAKGRPSDRCLYVWGGGPVSSGRPQGPQGQRQPLDKRAIFAATALAQKAADYFHGLQSSLRDA